MSHDFWSRRRAAVEAEARAEHTAQEPAALAEEHAALETQSDAEILAALDLPDPDSLKAGDDFSRFMAKAVPDRIRRRALRTLWKSNPVLANVDQLVDYGGDFTNSATVIENLQTAYQVGKGMLKHVEEMARQEAEKAAAADAPQTEASAPDDQPVDQPGDQPVEAPEETDALRVADAGDAPDQDTGTGSETGPKTGQGTGKETGQETEIPPLPRRMKFRVEETA